MVGGVATIISWIPIPQQGYGNNSQRNPGWQSGNVFNNRGYNPWQQTNTQFFCQPFQSWGIPTEGCCPEVYQNQRPFPSQRGNRRNREYDDGYGRRRPEEGRRRGGITGFFSKIARFLTQVLGGRGLRL